MINKKYFLLFCAVLFIIGFSAVNRPRAEDMGNELTRKKNRANMYYEPEEPTPKEFDDTLRIYLDSPKTSYKPGEKPEVIAYLKNESNKTRFFKRVWSPAGAEGSAFRFFMDGRESWGQGVFKRDVAEPESADPAKALRLDPGQRAEIVKITFLRLAEGSHTLNAEYDANYTVTEKQPRNWWQGSARSNSLALKVTRDLPRKEIDQALASVIKAIHKDLLALKSDYPELSGYGAAALTTPKGAFSGAPVIGYAKPRPSKFRIAVYFNKTDFQPNALATLNDGFPFLGAALFAHIDVGSARLREDVIRIVRTRGAALNDVTRRLEKYLSVDVQPFEDSVFGQFTRAPNIVLGTILKAEVETDKPFEYTLKKWILTVKVKDTFWGKVAGKTIKVKCSALTTTFGTEKVAGKDFIIMLLDKEGWQEEYNLIGAQAPRDNLTSWLKKKYSGK